MEISRMSNSPEKLEKIGVVGLGKLGSCVAACLASRGFEVIGIDTDPAKVEALQRGRAPVEEPGLQEKVNEGHSRLRATTNFAEVVAHSDACFFITPTPSLPDGRFDNQYLMQALQSVAAEVRKQKKANYLFNVNSTVTPGTYDYIFKPMFEKILGGQSGKDFYLYNPPPFIPLAVICLVLLQPDSFL